jgi:hypothetical protein
VIIVKDGEFDLSISKLDQVFVNQDTGRIKIKTSAGKDVVST